MSELITWARIEPHAQTTDIDVGLAAEVADPLWLLARQLQLGEFAGDDGGAPLSVEVRASWARLARYRPGPLPTDGQGAEGTQDWDPRATPLEAMVEAEPLDPDRAWRASVSGGQRLEDDLRRAGLGAALSALRAAFPFVADARAVPTGVSDRRYQAVCAGRVVDALALRAAMDDGRLDAVLADLADREHVKEVIAAWRTRLDDQLPVSSGANAKSAAWQPRRIEYAFSAAAPAPDGGELVLTAAEYDGSGLDWFHVDVAPGASLGLQSGGGVEHRQRRFLPRPIAFPGMPVDRFWEMEDGQVDLGTVDAGPTDLARLLATEYLVIYSPDWFVAPVELPMGCVARVDWVVVRDTFGVATLVGTAATQQSDQAGRQYQLATAASDVADVPLLFVPPAVLYGLQGRPLEEILIQRDELANMAWTIERSVLGPSGRPVSLERARVAGAARERVPAASFGADLLYQVATSVPANWSPLVAVPVPRDEGEGPGTQVMLRRARLLDTAAGVARGSVGQLAGEIDELFEEEVTRAGVRLTLADQLARWLDGRPVLWRGRRKSAGRGESESRLFFDHLSAEI